MQLRHVLASLGFAFLVALASGGLRPPLAGADHPIPPPLKQAPPTKFECRFAETPIKIDGEADDAAWKDAPVIESFHLAWLGAKARMARTSTKARLLWDREYLYFFADMEDTDLFADVKEHDGNTWENDVFELFLHPDRTRSGYYEFQVNAAATTFDSFMPKHDFDNFAKQKKLGDFHIDAKVKLRGTLNKRDDADKGWSVEGRIPWTDFLRTGGRPEPGEQWGLNLCRYDYHKDWKEPELSCIAPIAKPKVSSFFHQYADYCTLTFSGPAPIGLAKREQLTTSTVVGFPDPPLPYRVVRAIPDYRPDFPIQSKNIPGTDRLVVLTQPQAYAATKLEIMSESKPKDPPVHLLTTPTGGTATDFCFHPKFAENGYVYVGWGGRKGWWDPRKYCFITRYTMQTKQPFALDPASAKTILAWESNGHNGLAITFGLDGTMFVTSGDGTSDSDTNVTGQRTDLMLAKVLRIDVDHPTADKPYSVPKDNPFVNDKRFVPETWAYGLRNPWRICTDAKTGHIWVGQNGQDLWESAMLVRKGDNYGWSVTEGNHPFYPERKAGPTPIVKHTLEHHHAEARSLTGGIVYYGERYPDLKGAYIYGDYATGHIWAAKHDGEKLLWHRKIAITPLKITSFSLDSKGELLITDHAKAGEGGFYTFEPNPAPKESNFPRTLSASGLFDSVKGHKVKPSLMPYSINAPFWSDGAHKERFVAVPAGEGITFTRGVWGFPDKTVLVKSFALDTVAGRKWIETRFLTKQGGEWYGYSYEWNEAGTEATLVDAAGADRKFGEQSWHYPSRAECMTCHSRAANYVLGLTEMQMNKDHDYGNGKPENQIRAFERLGMFRTEWLQEVKGRVSDPVNKPEAGQREVPKSTLFTSFPTGLQKLTDPYDTKADLTARAKAWLHVNCSTCHVEAGGGNAQMELGLGTALDRMRIVDVKPVHQTFNLPDAKLIAPGAPERSVLIHRMSQRGVNTGQMPPLATFRVDDAGLALMKEWVKSLKK